MLPSSGAPKVTGEGAIQVRGRGVAGEPDRPVRDHINVLTSIADHLQAWQPTTGFRNTSGWSFDIVKDVGASRKESGGNDSAQAKTGLVLQRA